MMTPDEKVRYQAEYKKAMAAEVRRLVVFIAALAIVALVVFVFMWLRYKSGVFL